MLHTKFSLAKNSRFSWLSVVTHHADAWITTFAISVTALFVHGRLNPDNLLLSAAIAVGYWAAFALNDYYDIDVDRLDPQKTVNNFFIHLSDPLKSLRIILLLSAVFVVPVFWRYGWPALGVATVSAVVMWAYSAPPLRLKLRPIFDLAVHALFVQTFPYITTLILVKASWLPLDGVLLTLGLLTSSAAQLEQQIRDADQDARIGQTTTLLIGPSRALVLLKSITGFTIAYGLFFVAIGIIPPAVAPIGIIAIPAIIPRFWRTVNQPRPEKLIRFLLFIGVVYVVTLILFQLSVS